MLLCTEDISSGTGCQIQLLSSPLALLYRTSCGCADLDALTPGHSTGMGVVCACITTSTNHDFTPPYITLHYPTLPYITLHYPTLPYITLHYPTPPYITLHPPTLPYITLHYPTLPYITLLIFVTLLDLFLGTITSCDVDQTVPKCSLFPEKWTLVLPVSGTTVIASKYHSKWASTANQIKDMLCRYIYILH